ncbi:hypothetical protein [Actinoplanes sp. NPDC026619]|uniref:hypothetical protein n=1 Tax=Actinoplanes sp. NPDC026619 TaxID=3155798 RepID=UPI0033E7A4B4
MGKNSKRSAVVAGVAAVIIGGGAAAWAFTGWTVGGTGTADADASKIIPLTATASLGSNIYPGKVTTITMKVTNQNDFKVKLTGSISPTAFTVSGANTAAENTTCYNALIANAATVVTATNFPGTPEIASGAVNASVDSNVTIGDLPQSCAGLHIQASYTFTATQLA